MSPGGRVAGGVREEKSAGEMPAAEAEERAAGPSGCGECGSRSSCGGEGGCGGSCCGGGAAGSSGSRSGGDGGGRGIQVEAEGQRRDLGPDLLLVFNQVFENGGLSPTMKEGVISLLFKSQSPRRPFEVGHAPYYAC